MELQKSSIHQDGVDCGIGEFVCQFCLVANAQSWENKAMMYEAMAKSISDNCDRLKAQIAEAKTYIENGIENGDITNDELSEPFWEDLFRIFGIEAFEEIEAYLDVRVLATIKKPRGVDINTYDFDLDRIDISANEDGYEIEITESEITDVTEN